MSYNTGPSSGGGGGAPSGPAGGGLSGEYPNPDVNVSLLEGVDAPMPFGCWQILGNSVSAPSVGQATAQYPLNPADVSGDFRVHKIDNNGNNWAELLEALQPGDWIVYTAIDSNKQLFGKVNVAGVTVFSDYVTIPVSILRQSSGMVDGEYKFAYLASSKVSADALVGKVDAMGGDIQSTTGVNADMSSVITIELAQSNSAITPCTDGTYSPLTSITTVKGIITAIS